MVITVEQTTYTIKEFSEKVNLSAHTLRYYEKEGLLPSTNRRSNSHRIYSDHDIPRVTLIRCFRDTGMSIRDVKHYINLVGQGDGTAKERKQIILDQKTKIEEQLAELQKHLELINMKLNLYDKILAKNLECK